MSAQQNDNDALERERAGLPDDPPENETASDEARWRRGDDVTRELRMALHSLFDLLWQQKRLAMFSVGQFDSRRRSAHLWLATAMGLTLGETDIDTFDAQQCRRAIKLIEALIERSP